MFLNSQERSNLKLYKHDETHSKINQITLYCHDTALRTGAGQRSLPMFTFVVLHGYSVMWKPTKLHIAVKKSEEGMKKQKFKYRQQNTYKNQTTTIILWLIKW